MRGAPLDRADQRAPDRRRAARPLRPTSSPWPAAPGRRPGVRRANGIPRAHGSYEALLADPPSRPSTSRCRTACTSTGRCGRSRRASTSSARSRWTAGRRRWRRVRSRAAVGARADRGVHVAPPPADRAASRAARRGRDRRRPARAGRFSFTLAGDATCAGTRRSTAARSWTSAATPSAARGSSLAASRWGSPRGHDGPPASTAAGRPAALRRRRARHRRLRLRPAWPQRARGLGAEGRIGSPTRGTAASRGSSWSAASSARSSSPSPPTPTASSSRTAARRSAASARRSSGARTRSARRARSRPCTARPRGRHGAVG